MVDRRFGQSRKFLRYILAITICGDISMISSAAQSSSEIIIQVRPGVSEQQVKQLSERMGAEYQHALGGPAYLIRVDAQRVNAVTEKLRTQPEVISVEPNQPVRIPE